MRKLLILLLCLGSSAALAQNWSNPTSFSSTGTSTTVSDTAHPLGTTCIVQLASTSTSSANLDLEGSVDGTTYWYRLARESNPVLAGSIWAGSCAPYVRFNPSTHASGTLKGYLRWRTMASDPLAGTWKKIDVADAGTSFSFASASYQTSMVLKQTTGDYTLQWSNPGAARTITIPDPGGADSFVFLGATQTLTNKTLTSPTLTTPSLGVATATSVNKLTLTAPATSAVLTIADGKTLTASNTLTLAGTDGTTMTFPSTSASVARIDAAQTFVGAQTFTGSIQGSATAKALVAATPTIFATVAVASGGYVGGFLEYSVQSDDGVDYQARSGVIPFSAVNKAGTITCTVGTVGTATEVVAVSSGTLTNTFTCADATGNVMNLLAEAASSLTETTLQILPKVHVTGSAAVTYP